MAPVTFEDYMHSVNISDNSYNIAGKIIDTVNISFFEYALIIIGVILIFIFFVRLRKNKNLKSFIGIFKNRLIYHIRTSNYFCLNLFLIFLYIILSILIINYFIDLGFIFYSLFKGLRASSFIILTLVLIIIIHLINIFRGNNISGTQLEKIKEEYKKDNQKL